MQNNGLSQDRATVFALDPKYYPHIDPTTICPRDLLHLFPDGLLRSEGAWLMYILIKLGLPLRDVNAAKNAYLHFDRQVRVPDLHEGLKKGVAGGKPRSAATIRMTGREVMEFALHRCVCAREPWARRVCVCLTCVRVCDVCVCVPDVCVTCGAHACPPILLVVLAVRLLSARY